MYNARSEVLPKDPENAESLVLSDIDKYTLTNEYFLLTTGIKNKHLAFATKADLSIHGRSEVWVDGTFKCCPKIYYQIYTFHIIEKESPKPIIFCLLSNKSYESYIDLFHSIRHAGMRARSR